VSEKLQNSGDVAWVCSLDMMSQFLCCAGFFIRKKKCWIKNVTLQSKWQINYNTNSSEPKNVPCKGGLVLALF
jgi:hypothetical protein